MLNIFKNLRKLLINMLLIEFKPLIFASCFLFHLNRCKTRPGSNFFAEPWPLFTLVSAIPPGQNIRDRKKAFLLGFVKKTWQPNVYILIPKWKPVLSSISLIT